MVSVGCGECGGEVGTVRGRRTSWGVVSVGERWAL